MEITVQGRPEEELFAALRALGLDVHSFDDLPKGEVAVSMRMLITDTGAKVRRIDIGVVQ